MKKKLAALFAALTLVTFAIFGDVQIKSGATTDVLTIDPTSKAARTGAYDSAGREVTPQSKVTYSASNTFTPAATATDMVTICGSGTKTVRVVSFKLGTTNTAAGSQQYLLIRRSTADTAGTFVGGTAIKLDTNDAAATATVGHYTANPTLGTTVGTITTVRWASPAAVPGSFAGVAEDAAKDFLGFAPNSLLDRLPTLRGTGECLAANFAGAALVAGQTNYYSIVWIEE